MHLYDRVKVCDPYGREFESQVVALRPTYPRSNAPHDRVELEIFQDGQRLWFNAPDITSQPHRVDITRAVQPLIDRY